MKKITQEQINAIKNLLVKYNVGIQEFSAVDNMLNTLPVIEEKKKNGTN